MSCYVIIQCTHVTVEVFKTTVQQCSEQRANGACITPGITHCAGTTGRFHCTCCVNRAKSSFWVSVIVLLWTCLYLFNESIYFMNSNVSTMSRDWLDDTPVDGAILDVLMMDKNLGAHRCHGNGVQNLEDVLWRQQYHQTIVLHFKFRWKLLLTTQAMHSFFFLKKETWFNTKEIKSRLTFRS